VNPIGVGSRVDEPVPVGRPTTQVAALFAGLRLHRHGRAEPGPLDLASGLSTQHHHQRLVSHVVEVEGPVGLRDPQFYTVAAQRVRKVGQLASGERPRVLADHDRVEPAIGIGESGQQRGRLRPPNPGQLPGAADIEEFDHDPAPAGDQIRRDIQLPPL
jgi:hypothetical protein